MITDRQLGCPVCLEGVYAGTEPTFVVATVPAPADMDAVIPQGLAPTPLFDAAVIAYVGRPRARIPTADRDAVAALAPHDADALIRRVEDAVRLSDTVTPDDVGTLDLALSSRLNERFRALVPGLGVRGRDALTWRWMHRRYDR